MQNFMLRRIVQLVQFQVHETKHMRETTGKGLGSWWVQKKCGLLIMLDVINVIGVYFCSCKVPEM